MKRLFQFLVPLCMILVVFGVSDIKAQAPDTVAIFETVQTWDFEATLSDWVAGGDGSSIALSTEQALSDTQSVKMVKPATGLEINIQNDAFEDLQEGDVLTFHIWISAADSALVNGGQIFWQTGDGWSWNSQWVNGSSLIGNAWTAVKHTMPAIALPLQRIGFQLLLSTGNEAETPTIYVDDITVERPLTLITIDGEKDAFYSTLTGPDDGYLQLRAFTGNDNGYANGDADLSAKIWTAWDSTFFYVYEEVMDDMISMSSTNTYQNDGLELKFDPQATDSVINSIKGFDMTALDTTGGVTGVATLPNSFRKTTDYGYVIEAAIPWGSITTATESIAVAIDSVFGLGMHNHDNDNPNGNRDATVQWAAVMLDAVWNTPKYLAKAKFLAGNKLQLIPTNNMTGVTNTLPYDGTVPTEIVVDGKMDPFYHLLTGPDDGFIQVKAYANSEVGYPKGGDKDLSAKVWGSWDSTWLYIYAEMTDDTISLAGVSNNWETDAMEFKIDGIPDSATVAKGNSNECIFTAIDSSDAAAADKGVCDNLTAFADADKKYARGTVSGGYALEYAIRLDSLGGSEAVADTIGGVWGVGMNFIDNDGLHGRQAALVWGAESNDKIWSTPALHGTVKFLADNKVSFIAQNNMTGEVNPVPFDGTPFWMNIDGTKDGFYTSLTNPEDGYVQVQEFHYSDMGRPVSNADLSAKLWSAWDDTYFYLYAEIKDDTVACPNTANFYRNDCLELKVDGIADDSTQSGGVSSGTLTALDTTEATGVVNNLDEFGTKRMYARGSMSGGYTLEMAVELAALGGNEPIDVAVNKVFGMGINIVDNDGTLSTSNSQAAIIWGAVCDDHIWNTPKYHGTVKFLKDNKLKFVAENNMTGYGHGQPYDGSGEVSVENIEPVPLTYSLKQNYPNPFNPTTTISYSIRELNNVRLTVYDLLGREVATLVNEMKEPGVYRTIFDSKNCASGIYFYRIQAGSFVKTQKMMILK